MRYPVWEPERLQGMAALEELNRKEASAPYQCAEEMIHEWMAEPRVGVLMDLGRMRSYLPAILMTRDCDAPASAPAASSPPSLSPAEPADNSAVWSSCWRCSSQPDCLASMLVQVLGVKESADLKEGFGFFVQHLLSGGLEKAHAKRKGGAEGNTFQKTQNREREKRGAGDGRKGSAGEKKGGRDGKDGDWKKHLKGRVWERYVDGMAWILERGGGSSGAPTARWAAAAVVAAAVVVAAVLMGLAAGATRKAGIFPRAFFILDGNNASKTRVEDAAIEEARGRLERERQRREKQRRETSERGRGCGAAGSFGGVAVGYAPAEAAAAAEAPPLLAASSPGAAPSAGAPTSAASSAVSTAVRVPVNSNAFLAAFTYRVSCILQWVRIYGSDSISANQCFKDMPQEHNLPIRHPFHDLPSLLVRFGAIPKPLAGAKHFCEWEEWPQGNEDAMKFPDDPSARCFGVGIVEESEE
ncbi:unnamed protein product, partial [Closterium sp. NIES-53]